MGKLSWSVEDVDTIGRIHFSGADNDGNVHMSLVSDDKDCDTLFVRNRRNRQWLQ